MTGPSLAGTRLTDRPRLVALNKIDVPEARDLADLVKPELEARGPRGLRDLRRDHEGLRELGFAMAELVASARERRSPDPEPVRVVIRPARGQGDRLRDRPHRRTART